MESGEGARARSADAEAHRCHTPSKYRIQRVDHFRSRSTLDFTAQEVLTFLGTPSAIRYAATRSQPLRDIDGRAAARPGSGIVGTPGGDAGEFILVLQIYETLRGGGF